MREVDPTFHEELINYGRSRSHMLNMAHFKDDSSPNGTKFLSPIVDTFLLKNWVFYFYFWDCFDLLCSMGLFCLGPYLCLIFGGETGVLSRIEVWRWDRSPCKKFVPFIKIFHFWILISLSLSLSLTHTHTHTHLNCYFPVKYCILTVQNQESVSFW